MTGKKTVLSHPGYFSSDNLKRDFDAIIKRLTAKRDAGEPIYVTFKDSRRKGSIGELVSFEVHDSNRGWGNSTPYFYITDMEVRWEGRKNTFRPSSYDVYWLEDYTGPTVWSWEITKQEKKERVIPYDHLGMELEPGKFVCFVHRRYGVISMKFGTVTRVSNKGTVWAKTLKLRDGDPEPEELKLFGSEDATVVDDALLKRLVMARLSAS